MQRCRPFLTTRDANPSYSQVQPAPLTLRTTGKEQVLGTCGETTALGSTGAVSIIFIVVCTLLLVANLIAMIINFCFSVQAGVSSLFVGFINCAISIFLLGLLITMAHNISKMTRATLFMCSKLMRDEKRYMEELKKQKEQSEDAVADEKDVEVKYNETEDVTNVDADIVIE